MNNSVVYLFLQEENTFRGGGRFMSIWRTIAISAQTILFNVLFVAQISIIQMNPSIHSPDGLFEWEIIVMMMVVGGG